MHDIKIVASSLATILALAAYLPYLRDMFRGNTRPHLYTWISIFLITSIVAYIQLRGGAGIGAIPTILGAAIDAIILALCFKYGTKDVVFIDKICLGITLLGVLFYIILFNHPAISLVIVIIAEIISFIPTFRKTKNAPYSEYMPTQYVLLLKLGLTVVALEKYNPLTVSYSATWIVVIAWFIIAMYRWRSKADASKQKLNIEKDPPLI